MPTLLSDPSSTVYLVLAAASLVAFGVWFSRRTRRALVALGVVAGIAALVLVVDLMVESAREESVRRALAMVEAASARNRDEFLSHVAEKLEYTGESSPVVVTREQLRESQMWGMLERYQARVAAWDFARDDVKHIDDDTLEIGFLVKGEVQGKQVPMYFRAKFARQADGQMKLVALASFDPLKRVNERKSIPYFP